MEPSTTPQLPSRSCRNTKAERRAAKNNDHEVNAVSAVNNDGVVES